MARLIYIFLFCFILISVFSSQILPFKTANKFGFTKDGADFIAPIYDTVLPFDTEKKICMACVKTQKPATNKFIKMNNSVILCKYINANKEELVITVKGDTCSYFALNKYSYNNYHHYKNYIVVNAKDKKYVVNSNFKQITFTGYDEITPSKITDFFIVENKTIGTSYLEGVINKNEKLIVPMTYTSIKDNPHDSLFITCTAQLKLTGNDDVFNVNGEKVQTFNRHIDNATKNFIIHKIFEPKEYYVVLNLQTKKETTIYAEDISYLGNDRVGIKLKGKLHECNLFELDTYKFLNHE